MMNYQSRQDKLRKRFTGKHIDALLVTHQENRRYLTGFESSAGFVLVTRRNTFLLLDGRYFEQAKKEVPENVVLIGADPAKTILKYLKPEKIARLGVESEDMNVRQYGKMGKKMPGIKLIQTVGLAAGLRIIKDEEEIKCIKKAFEIAENAWREFLPEIRPHRTESETAEILRHILAKNGSEKESFPVIFTSGPGSAWPHGSTTKRILQKGDIIVCDFGAVYRGYHSDLTKTVALGIMNPHEKKVYNILRNAWTAAVKAAKQGVMCCAIDESARSIIRKAGFGRYFVHSTGHGLGLEIHEGPSLVSGEKNRLKPGMVVTIEPGIYLPGKFGMRIENAVIIRRHGAELLGRIPCNLKNIWLA